MKIRNPPGAQFEILVDGEARSYRDTKSGAMDAPRFSRAETHTARSR